MWSASVNSPTGCSMTPLALGGGRCRMYEIIVVVDVKDNASQLTASADIAVGFFFRIIVDLAFSLGYPPNGAQDARKLEVVVNGAQSLVVVLESFQLNGQYGRQFLHAQPFHRIDFLVTLFAVGSISTYIITNLLMDGSICQEKTSNLKLPSSSSPLTYCSSESCRLRMSILMTLKCCSLQYRWGHPL